MVISFVKTAFVDAVEDLPLFHVSQKVLHLTTSFLVRSRHRVQGRSSSVRERLLSGSVHAVRQRREHECSAYRPDVPRGPWMAFPVQVQDKSAVAPPVWTNRTLLPAGIRPARTLPTSPENTLPV